MSILKFIKIVLLIGIVNMGCHNHTNDPLLKEAFGYHTAAIQIEQLVNGQIKALQSKMNNIQIQGRTLTKEEQGFLKKSQGVFADFENWKKNRIEVPDFEHQHEHSHDCKHHHHQSKIQLTPQQMMEIQLESLNNIKKIQQDLDAL